MNWKKVLFNVGMRVFFIYMMFFVGAGMFTLGKMYEAGNFDITMIRTGLLVSMVMLAIAGNACASLFEKGSLNKS